MSADAGTPTAEAAIKATSYLSALVPIIEEIVAPSAAVVDREGIYPREALDALGQAGLLGRPYSHRGRYNHDRHRRRHRDGAFPGGRYRHCPARTGQIASSAGNR